MRLPHGHELILDGPRAARARFTLGEGAQAPPAGVQAEARRLRRERQGAGERVHDGRMLQVASFDASAGRGRLQEGSYWDWQAAASLRRRGEEAPAMSGLGVHAVAVTRDGLVVCCQRSEHVKAPGLWDATAAEGADPRDIHGGEATMAPMLMRALAEELGAGPADLLGVRCLGLAADPEGSALFWLAAAYLNASSREAVAMAARAHDAWEVQDVRCVSLPDAQAESLGPQTPMSAAALHLLAAA